LFFDRPVVEGDLQRWADLGAMEVDVIVLHLTDDVAAVRVA
jgi:hypothetical protein